MSWIETLVTALSPPVCLVCRTVIPPGESLCALCSPCLSDLQPSTHPLTGLTAYDRRLSQMSSLSGPSLVSLGKYDGVLRRTVLSLKRGCPDRLVRLLAAGLAPAFRHGERFDALTWVPASISRQRQMGADHAARLAGALSRELNVKSTRMLVRRGGKGSAQHELSAADRRSASGGRAIVACKRLPASAPKILLVDDVCTTGATLLAAAEALISAGAGSVSFGVIAVTSLDRQPGNSKG